MEQQGEILESTGSTFNFQHTVVKTEPFDPSDFEVKVEVDTFDYYSPENEQLQDSTGNGAEEIVQQILSEILEKIPDKESVKSSESLKNANKIVGTNKRKREKPVRIVPKQKKLLLELPKEKGERNGFGKVILQNYGQIACKDNKKTKQKARKKSNKGNGRIEIFKDVESRKTDEEKDSSNLDENKELKGEQNPSEEGKKVKTKKGKERKNDDLIEEKVTCPICNRQLSSGCNLKRHLRTATCIAKQTEISFTLEEGESNLTMALFDPPMEKKFYDCVVCGKKLASITSLKRHLGTVHALERPNVERNVPCQQEGCERLFDSPASMRKHYNAVHLNIRKYLCEICSSMFKTCNALKIHMLTIHNRPTDGEIVRHDCPICHRSFSSNGKLMSHSTVHTGDKPYTCEIEGCNKTFRLKSSYKKHMQIFHQEIKPFVCEICNQAFTRRIYLETHQYKHTGVKMFKCSICSKRFSQKGNLNVHMKQHSTYQNPYRCKLCDKSYLTQQSLYQHRRSKHGIHEADPDYIEDVKIEAEHQDEVSVLSFDYPTFLMENISSS